MKSPKKTSFPRHLSLTNQLALLLISLSFPAFAATLTWDGNTGTAGMQDGGGNWNTTDTNRWHNGSGYEQWTNNASSPHSAVFGNGSGAAGTVTLTTPIIAGGLTFNVPGSGNYTIASSAAANTLTLAGTSSPIITVNGITAVPAVNASATISGVLAGTNGFTKMGSENLNLTGSLSNTLTGTVYVTEGTLTLNKTGGATAIAGDIVINGGNLSWSQMNMVDDEASITLISGALGFGSRAETIKNLSIQGGNSNLGTGSNGGALTVKDTLSATGGGTLGLNSGAQWSIYKTVFSGNSRVVLGMTGNTNARISQYIVGAGGLSMTGQTVSLNKGTLADAKGSEVLLNGNVTTSGANAFNFNGTGGGVARLNLGSEISWDVAAQVTSEITNVAMAIAGEAGLTKTGAGVLAFSSADSNSYTGLTTVTNGTLRLAKTSGATAIVGDILVNGGVLDWDQPNNLGDEVSITLTAGSLKFDNLTEVFKDLTQTGGMINNGGNTNSGLVTLTGTLKMSGGSSLSLNSGGQWTVNKADFTGFSGNVLGLNGNSATRETRLTIGPGGLIMTGQTISLNIGTDAPAKGSDIILNGDVTASGSNNFTAPGTGGGIAQINLGAAERTWNIISGTTSSSAAFVGAGGGIRKTGAGILALNAAATYTGKTTVDAGTFRLGNAAAAIDDSAWLEVNAGGTFHNNTGAAYIFDGVLSGAGSLTGNMIIGSNRGGVSGNGVLKPGGSSDGTSVAAAGNLRGTITFTGNLDLGAPVSPGISIVRAQLEITGATGSALSSYTGGSIATWVAGIPAAHGGLVTGTAGNHDHLEISGALTLNAGGEIEVVNPGDAYVPAFGDVFNLADWSSLTNNGFAAAADLNLPDITTSGFVWNTDLFLSHGVIVVVPEPGRVLLVGLGLLGLGMRRRRR